MVGLKKAPAETGALSFVGISWDFAWFLRPFGPGKVQDGSPLRDDLRGLVQRGQSGGGEHCQCCNEGVKLQHDLGSVFIEPTIDPMS